MERYFVHPDGRKYSLEVVDNRVVESWVAARAKRGSGNTSTREDNADAIAHAAAKVKKLLKDGYVEQAPSPAVEHDRNADVLATLRTDVDSEGVTRYPFEPMSGRPGFHRFSNISVAEWMMVSDAGTRGVVLRTVVWDAAKMTSRVIPDGVVAPLLDTLALHREAIFADEETPVRSFPLVAPFEKLTRLVVISPVVENAMISRDVNIQNPVLARSLYRAFPVFDCEFIGDETAAVAEARVRGRSSIRTSKWAREPDFVFDLAYVKKPKQKPKFLVFDRKELDRRFAKAALAKLGATETIHARNYEGEVRTFAKGDAPNLAELRRWFLGA